MAVVSARLVAATREQLSERARLLDAGATHVGWKLGMSDRESIDGHIVVGYLTSATRLDPGGAYRSRPGEDLHVDVEAYVELAGDGPGAVGACGVALEIVDLTPHPGEPDSIVATNVFHRAVSFADPMPLGPAPADVGIQVNGELRRAGAWPDDLADRLAGAAEVLETVGLALRAGDRVITGSIVQVPIALGERIAAVVGDDPALSLAIT
jgi:hypothetical protein